MKRYLLLIALLLICTEAFAFNGRKTVTSAGTAEAISSTDNIFNQCQICAETDNTGTIAVGDSGVVATLASRTGVPLDAGDCYSLVFAPNKSYNLTSVYIDSTVSGDGVTYQCIYSY